MASDASWVWPSLVTLFAALLGSLVGAYAVYHSQRGEHIWRDRAAASSLLQDLARIRSHLHEIDTPAWRGQLYSMSRIEIHPWVTPLIVQLAARDDVIVGHFMRLEPTLNALLNAGQLYDTACNNVKSYEDEVNRRIAEGSGDGQSAGDFAKLLSGFARYLRDGPSIAATVARRGSVSARSSRH